MEPTQRAHQDEAVLSSRYGLSFQPNCPGLLGSTFKHGLAKMALRQNVHPKKFGMRETLVAPNPHLSVTKPCIVLSAWLGFSVAPVMPAQD